MISIKNLLKNCIMAGVTVSFFVGMPRMAAPEGLFGGKEEILWESGVNLYIKLAEQDKSPSGKTAPNDQPVVLKPKDITDALSSIEFWEKKGILKESTSNVAFASSQANLLGNYLSRGLSKAKPDQDIIFALAKIPKGTLGFGNKLYMAGRAFYKDDRLHIILGDYDRPTDKGREAAEGAAGVTEVQYFFKVGSRSKASGFKKTIITGNGIDSYKQGNKLRRDWFVIDVTTAAAAYVARTEKKDRSGGADAEIIRQEADRLAQERREMRAEMARMRKEMNEIRDNDGEQQTGVEERLDRLEELHDKKLITDDEYNRKRQEILDEI